MGRGDGGRGLRCLPPRMAPARPRVSAPAKTADPHYLTPEHAAWRAAVIRRAGGLCQGEDCPTPGRRAGRLYADHIVELRDGGAPLDLANGQALCARCHALKTLRERARRAAQPT